MERKMRIFVKGFVLAWVILSSSAAASFAASQDYKFDVVNQPVKAAHDAVIVVHVMPVPPPTFSITSQNLHMAMGSVDAPAKITPLPQDANGDYRFSADLTMYGEWTLDLVATVADQPAPVKTSLKVQVVK
jgi:hypothetical protein